jgi:hypothetical protein
MKKIIKNISKKSKKIFFNNKSFFKGKNKIKINMDKYLFMSENEKKLFLYESINKSLSIGQNVEIDC